MAPFVWIGNHPGLDFLNTVARDDDGRPVELLDGFSALRTWLETSGVVDGGLSRRVRRTEREPLIEWTRRLRDASRDVIDRTAANEVTGRRLDAILAEVPVRLTSSTAADHTTPVTAASAADRIRVALALAVLEALRLDPARVRRCGRPGCVRLFFDTSKNGTRRWCDMAVCGNRIKAAAHYRRQQDLLRHRR